MSVIDLAVFCFGDQNTILSLPFSAGAWTYATDGSIVVRVPRRADVGQDPEYRTYITRFDRWLAEDASRDAHLAPLQPLWRPPPSHGLVACKTCGGSGKTECPACGGPEDCLDCENGKVEADIVLVEVAPLNFISNKYWHMLAPLPGLRMDLRQHEPDNPVRRYFRFDGGEGLLMGCRMNPVREMIRLASQPQCAHERA
jgi:hypothetical protein